MVPTLSEADRRSAESKCTWSESHGRRAVIDRQFWLLNYRCKSGRRSAYALTGFGVM